MAKRADQPSSCYLLIAYGDRSLEQTQRAQYEATIEFLRQNASIYGWPDTLDALSETEAALLAETFDGARVAAPDALTSCRLEIQLHVEVAPRAAANFAELCRGLTNKQGVSYCYKDTSFHRYVPSFCIQGGDVNGRGGDSIYGGTFKDERPGLKQTHSFGVVSMANTGPNTNRSQFFLCLSREETNPSIDGKHVIVGHVTNEDGLKFLEAMDAALEQDDDESPKQDVFVVDAGICDVK